MGILTYTAAMLAKWLPADYESATNWTAADVDAALTAGHHPHTIAAEVWDEYAMSLPGDDTVQVVKSWTNGDQSETYTDAKSARQFARSEAARHRAQGPVRAVQQSAPNPVADVEVVTTAYGDYTVPFEQGYEVL